MHKRFNCDFRLKSSKQILMNENKMKIIRWLNLMYFNSPSYNKITMKQFQKYFQSKPLFKLEKKSFSVYSLWQVPSRPLIFTYFLGRTPHHKFPQKKYKHRFILLEYWKFELKLVSSFFLSIKFLASFYNTQCNNSYLNFPPTIAK